MVAAVSVTASASRATMCIRVISKSSEYYTVRERKRELEMRMQWLVIVLVGAFAAMSRPQTPTPNPQLLCFDDFSDKHLDRSKWDVIVTGRTVNNEQQAYVDSADTITVGNGPETIGAENGALIIRARNRPGFKTPEGRSFDFIS